MIVILNLLIKDDLTQSVDEEVLIKENDIYKTPQVPISRDAEKEYLLKIQKDLADQYENEMENKNDMINKLRDMVVKQNQIIQDMQSQSEKPSKTSSNNKYKASSKSISKKKESSRRQ